MVAPPTDNLVQMCKLLVCGGGTIEFLIFSIMIDPSKELVLHLGYFENLTAY